MQLAADMFTFGSHVVIISPFYLQLVTSVWRLLSVITLFFRGLDTVSPQIGAETGNKLLGVLHQTQHIGL
jgi:hypothetical protein